MSVKDNLLGIKNNLPAGVSLVAVSKTKSESQILEAYDAGQRDFGENYVQELVRKEALLPKDINWHYIGHLQSNKIKHIAPFVHLIHGVDSLKLLAEINKQALKFNRKISCLLQVHIAREDTKFGFFYEEAIDCLNQFALSPMPGVDLIGLMGMASNSNDMQLVREEYHTLNFFFQEQQKVHSRLRILSCGMSSDYAIAVEEGSTMVRIGSSIFGERNYEDQKTGG